MVLSNRTYEQQLLFGNTFLSTIFLGGGVVDLREKEKVWGRRKKWRDCWKKEDMRLTEKEEKEGRDKDWKNMER